MGAAPLFWYLFIGEFLNRYTMIARLLQRYINGEIYTTEDWHQLVNVAQRYDQWCLPCDVANRQAVKNSLEKRLALLKTLYPNLCNLCNNTLGWSAVPLVTAWKLWLPLAMLLNQDQLKQGLPLVQGILGGQGTGKTSLGAVLALILGHLGQRVCSLSIDDLYKTYAERCVLKKNDPRLIWRGPPGTHDVALGIDVLRGIRLADPGTPIKVPRFDKSACHGAGDRTTPESVSGITIVLFEGWFVGVKPVDVTVFDRAPEPIVTESDRAFARDSNERLSQYLPLWEQLDQLMVLYPTNYRFSQRWRQQAEQAMRASGREGMEDEEISQFVTYFWRSLHPELFITPLLNDRELVNVVVEIDANHTPCAIYRPS